jgi:hypothetical protein
MMPILSPLFERLVVMDAARVYKTAHICCGIALKKICGSSDTAKTNANRTLSTRRKQFRGHALTVRVSEMS